MCINDFSSYFEIFAALNLGYAGSEAFRMALNDEILKLRNTSDQTVQNRLTEIRSKLTASQASDENSAAMEDKLGRYERNYKQVSESITEEDEAVSEVFVIGFKPMFLMSALFCFAILIIGGFEQFSVGQWEMNITLFLLTGVLLFNAGIFAKSFSRWSEKKIRSWVPLIVIMLLIGCSYFACGAEETEPGVSHRVGMWLNEKYLMVLALFVALSPYVFHIIKAFRHKATYGQKMQDLIAKTEKRLEIVDNWIDLPGANEDDLVL